MLQFYIVPNNKQNANKDIVKNIKANYRDKQGNQRQEIIIIREGFNKKGIIEVLDKCLLNQVEIQSQERIIRKKIKEEEREDILREKQDNRFYAKQVTKSIDKYNYKYVYYSYSYKH